MSVSVSGSVYLFNRNQVGPDNWEQVQKVTDNDPKDEVRRGATASISGNVLVIGAGNDNENGYRSGSAYVFQKNDEFPWGMSSPAFIKKKNR